MTLPEFLPLCRSQRRLLDHFYRQHGSRMRASAEGQLWVARAQAMVGALNLTPVAEGHWLTGLFVAPQWRGQGVAAGLVSAALANSTGPTWLFCHPELQSFYARQAFTTASALPVELASRLARYQRSKTLVAMVCAQSSATSSPGNSTSV